MQNVAAALLGNHGLAGVQALVTGAEAQAALRDVLGELLGGQGEQGAWRLQRAKFKPGRKLNAYYDVEVRVPGEEASRTRPVAVTWTLAAQAGDPAGGPVGDTGASGREQEARGQEECEQMAGELAQRGLAFPFVQLAAAVPEWGMKLEVAPLDPLYPQLPRLCDPSYAGGLLASCAAQALPGYARVEYAQAEYAVTPVRYRPGQRHVLRYTPIPPEAGAAVIAKLYRPQPTAAGSLASFCALTVRVADWLETCTPAATVLRPAACVAEDAAVLYPWVDGVALAELHRCAAGEVAAALAATGAALCGLHAAHPDVTEGLPRQDLGGELKAVARACEHIAVLLPPAWHAIEDLLGGAAPAYASLPQEDPTFLHGDFKGDHVLVAPGPRLTLIDFDACRVGDPALDIGKFLADLDWAYAGCAPQELAAAQGAFLAGYGLGARHPRLLRARVVEAAILVKLTARRVKLFEPGWAERTAALVARAEALLADCPRANRMKRMEEKDRQDLQDLQDLQD